MGSSHSRRRHHHHPHHHRHPPPPPPPPYYSPPAPSPFLPSPSVIHNRFLREPHILARSEGEGWCDVDLGRGGLRNLLARKKLHEWSDEMLVQMEIRGKHPSFLHISQAWKGEGSMDAVDRAAQQLLDMAKDHRLHCPLLQQVLHCTGGVERLSSGCGSSGAPLCCAGSEFHRSRHGKRREHKEKKCLRKQCGLVIVGDFNLAFMGRHMNQAAGGQQGSSSNADTSDPLHHHHHPPPTSPEAAPTTTSTASAVLDIRRLVELVERERGLRVRRRIVLGSHCRLRPGGRLWRLWRHHAYRPIAANDEVQAQIAIHSIGTLVRTAHRRPGMVVIVAGEGSLEATPAFADALRAAVIAGTRLQVWGWADSMPALYKALRFEFPNRVDLAYLDDYRGYLRYGSSDYTSSSSLKEEERSGTSSLGREITRGVGAVGEAATGLVTEALGVASSILSSLPSSLAGLAMRPGGGGGAEGDNSREVASMQGAAAIRQPPIELLEKGNATMVEAKLAGKTFVAPPTEGGEEGERQKEEEGDGDEREEGVGQEAAAQPVTMMMAPSMARRAIMPVPQAEVSAFVAPPIPPPPLPPARHAEGVSRQVNAEAVIVEQRAGVTEEQQQQQQQERARREAEEDEEEEEGSFDDDYLEGGDDASTDDEPWGGMDLDARSVVSAASTLGGRQEGGGPSASEGGTATSREEDDAGSLLGEEDEYDDYPEPFLDPLTFEVMIDPVMAPSGFSYERSVIVEEIQRRGRDPLTQESLVEEDLRPNRALRDAIELYRSQRLVGINGGGSGGRRVGRGNGEGGGGNGR